MNARVSRLGLLVFLLSLSLAGCGIGPFEPASPTPDKSLVYDAPVSLTIRNGTTLPGTPIGYGGKLPTGAAKVLIAGQMASKQIADSVEWQGSPAPNVSVKLTTRVASFDDKGITLLGTAHIEIANATAQAASAPSTSPIEFNAPVTYSIAKSSSIPGSTIVYAGSTKDGAQFTGLEGFPYRKSLDSLQYTGKVNPKVFLKLDLRLINFSDSEAILGGTAGIQIEPQAPATKP